MTVPKAKRKATQRRDGREIGEKILLLESPLDQNRDPTQRRGQGQAMSEVMKAWGCSDLFEYEGGVINAEALIDHLKRVSKKVGLVHLVGHGESRGRPRFLLVPSASRYPQWLDLSRQGDRRILRPLKGRVLMFSCCDLGKETCASSMKRLLSEAGLKALIAYRKAITDDQATFVDSLFYYAWVQWRRLRLEEPPWKDPSALAERVKWALVSYGLHTDKDPLFVTYLPSDSEGVETIL